MIDIKHKKLINKDAAKKIIAMGISLRDSLNKIDAKCLDEYDPDKTYAKESVVLYDGYTWICKNPTTGEFNKYRWTKIGDNLQGISLEYIKENINITDEDLETLSKIILDSEIRLDKTFSSSKIYKSIQDALKDSKKYTLEQFAKANKASYHVVTNTSEMTDTSIIYLLKNDSNFDMYIVENDTATKIGDTTIDLSDYLKKTDLVGYLKEADADSKYALIETVNNKIDKSSISTSIPEEGSDEKVLSEKVVKQELDKKIDSDNAVKKTDMVTVIDSTVSDSDIPSALSVINAIKTNSIALDMFRPSTLDELDNLCVTNGIPDSKTYIIPVNPKVVLDAPFGGSVMTIIGMQYANSKYGYQYSLSKDCICYRALNNGVWDTWKILCSATIKDVAKTKITLDSNVWSSGSASYQIINGICYVSFVGMIAVEPGIDLIVSDKLPKSSIYKVKEITMANGVLMSTKKYPIQARIQENSTILVIHCREFTSGMYGEISYPVAKN